MTVVQQGIIAEIVLLALMLLILIIIFAKPRKASYKDRTLGKKGVVVTYLFALLCLWAGLLLPMYGVGRSGADAMLIRYVPGAVNTITDQLFGKAICNWDWTLPFDEVYGGSEYQYLVFGKSINLIAYAVVVYAAFAALGVLMLIPIALGKKDGRFSLKCASFIEVFALVSILFYVLFVCGSGLPLNNDGILIAAAGVTLALVFQCSRSKPDLGAYKVIMFILSVLAALQLIDLTSIVQFLYKPFKLLAKTVGSTVGFIGESEGYAYFATYTLDFEALKGVLKIADTKEMIFLIAAIGGATMVIFNLLVDTIGLATGKYYSRKGKVKHNIISKFFGFLRYTLEFLCVAVTIVMAFVLKITVGLYLYVLTLVSLLRFMAGLLRLTDRVKRNKEKKAEETAEVTEEEQEDLEEEPEAVFADEQPEEEFDDGYAYETEVYADEQPEEDVSEEPLSRKELRALKKAEKKTAKQEAKDAARFGVVAEGEYNGDEDEVFYNGPTDSFIDTLDVKEKNEFKDVFLDKNKGNISGLPDYQVGGDNSRFFASLFAYLGTLKRITSDDLLNKFYEKVTETK